MRLVNVFKMATKSKSPPDAQFFTRPRTNDGTRTLFKCFFLSGIIMPNKFKAAYVCFSVIINILVVLLPISFTLSYFVGSEKLQINNFLTSLQICFNAYGCVSRFSCIFFNRHNIFKIEAIFNKLDARMKYPEELQEARNTIRFGNSIVALFLTVYYTYSTVTTMGGLYAGRPAYGVYIPFLDWRESPQKFYAHSLFENFWINAALIHQVCNDVYPVVYVGIFNGYMKILIMRVLRIGTDPLCSPEDNKKELIRCVLDHKDILELIQTIEPVISMTSFIQFLATSAAMGTTLINIAICNDNYTLFGSLTHVCCLVIEIFWICYYVNVLMDTGLRLPTAIFHMNWVDQDQEFRRMCIFYMQQAQQEISLYAGKLFPISLDTFVSIMKFSFSVYTLLTTMDFAH